MNLAKQAAAPYILSMMVSYIQMIPCLSQITHLEYDISKMSREFEGPCWICNYIPGEDIDLGKMPYNIDI